MHKEFFKGSIRKAKKIFFGQKVSEPHAFKIYGDQTKKLDTNI